MPSTLFYKPSFADKKQQEHMKFYIDLISWAREMKPNISQMIEQERQMRLSRKLPTLNVGQTNFIGGYKSGLIEEFIRENMTLRRGDGLYYNETETKFSTYEM